MSNESIIQVFEGMNVRIIWNEQEEKYYFAVADIVQVLTDTTNPTDYLKKMRQRDKELSKGWGQIVTPLSYQTLGGKQKINFADIEGIFRIIQSIPSKKAESVKQWLAEVGAQRIDHFSC
ncbi:MAG: Bro-N domain-containing protein [Bacteroidales bacterium]|nr:Bro-N domain-containing protein [Bacteroidales bacterium]